MTIYKSLSENELIILLRDGSENAYTEIYHRYHHLMFVFAYKKLRDEELAKDFVQELFSHLWVNRGLIKEDGNLAQYLYITLRSRLFNFFAHQKVEHKYIGFLGSYTNEQEEKQTDYLIREKQLSTYIEEQIQNLPKKMKEVFEMSRKEYLSNKEIAEKLDTTESNVSQHISNAVKILKTKLGAIFISLFF